MWLNFELANQLGHADANVASQQFIIRSARLTLMGLSALALLNRFGLFSFVVGFVCWPACATAGQAAQETNRLGNVGKCIQFRAELLAGFAWASSGENINC